MAGWQAAGYVQANIHIVDGVALREFPSAAGYLLYVDGEAVGIIEAKKRGATLIGMENQSSRYAAGLPVALPAGLLPTRRRT